MTVTAATKTQMLAAFTADAISLHNGDPTAAGTANEISGGGYVRLPPVYAAVDADTIDITPLDFSASAGQAVTHYVVWDGATVKDVTAISSGDTSFNASGEFTLKSASISLT